MQNKAKRKIDYKRVLWCLAMMVLGTMMFMVPAFAKAPSATKTMTNLISLMCSMFSLLEPQFSYGQSFSLFLQQNVLMQIQKLMLFRLLYVVLLLWASPLSLQLLVLVPLSMMRT